MIRRYGILFIFLFIAAALNAQHNTIHGIVKDAQTGKPIETATIALLHPVDSGIVKGTITDSTGKFSIKASDGEYMVKIQYVTYQSVIKSGIMTGPNHRNVDIGKVFLEESHLELSEVVVEGELSHMTMEGGKKVFNVGRDLSSAGMSAADVLENIPAVTMDIEGNISLRGSQGVRVLVNGRPSSMMGLSGTEALRYFPANLIEKVEIITNPSAKYEAQGAAGIINIILKEQQAYGLNGTFSFEAGYPKDYGASVSMNYRNKWYNIFGNYNINTNENPGGGWSERTFNYPDTTYSLRTDNDRIRGEISHNIQFGSDFYFTPNDVLKISGGYEIDDEDNYTDITYFDYSDARIHPEDLTKRSVRDELEEEKDGDYELNANYEKKFGSKDHKLTADAQWRNSIEIEDASLIETSGLPGTEMDTSLFQHSLNDSEVKAYLAKIDYTWPFSEDGKFETGFRGEMREIVNEYYVDQRETEADPWSRLERFSNIFTYNEAIYGLYAMYENTFGMFTIQGGLRYEFTGIGTELQTEAAGNDRSYSNFFPSFALSYDLNELNSVQLSYSRRLDRPHFRELNPYNTFNDRRNYRTGNPDLDPEFTGAYDLGYIYNDRDGGTSFYMGAFYRRTINEIERVDTINDDGITVMKPFNLSSRDNMGVETRYSMELYDWWDFNISSFVYRGTTTGNAAGEDLNASSYTMDGRAMLNFDVSDWFELQFNAYYRAPEEEGQDKEKAMYAINMGIRRDLFNKKGNLSFSIRDIFDTHKYQSTTEGSNFTSRNQFQWRYGPVFSLSFSYRLKDTNNNEKRGHVFNGGGGPDDE
ncbi:MAG: TonB-dependent receptor [Bacteroidetes bacterium]|jgi:outer membrane receptor protein involved in Fe transport|nr:TonB-dependent receptor [Bacteroidota bacterium]